MASQTHPYVKQELCKLMFAGTHTHNRSYTHSCCWYPYTQQQLLTLMLLVPVHTTGVTHTHVGVPIHTTGATHIHVASTHTHNRSYSHSCCWYPYTQQELLTLMLLVPVHTTGATHSCCWYLYTQELLTLMLLVPIHTTGATHIYVAGTRTHN